MIHDQHGDVSGAAGMTNPYVIDLSFEADLRIRKIQQVVLKRRHAWKTPAEIITDALYWYAEHQGIRDDRYEVDDSGDEDAGDGDDHRGPDPDRPGSPPPPGDAVEIIREAELVLADAAAGMCRQCRGPVTTADPGRERCDACYADENAVMDVLTTETARIDAALEGRGPDA